MADLPCRPNEQCRSAEEHKDSLPFECWSRWRMPVSLDVNMLHDVSVHSAAYCPKDWEVVDEKCQATSELLWAGFVFRCPINTLILTIRDHDIKIAVGTLAIDWWAVTWYSCTKSNGPTVKASVLNSYYIRKSICHCTGAAWRACIVVQRLYSVGQ